MKLLPHGVCQKLPKPVPTRSSSRVEQFCFLVRRNPTVGLAGILERSGSLSLSLENHKMATVTPFFLSRFLFLCFILSFLLFFLFLFHFLPHFLLSLCISLLLFGAMTVWVKRRKFPPLLPQAKCVSFPFSFIFFYFIIPLYDIITYMAQCEPWNSCHPCGSM